MFKTGRSDNKRIMGNYISTTLQDQFYRPNFKLVMIGEYGSGRTTALYRLKLGQRIDTVPTIGNNVQTIDLKHCKMELWDLGGLCNVRKYWNRYYEDADGIVFFFDLSNNTNQYIQQSCKLWKGLMENKFIRDAPILIVGNKIDEAKTPLQKIVELLRLQDYSSRQLRVLGANSLTGEGLGEGLEWIYTQLMNSRIKK